MSNTLPDITPDEDSLLNVDRAHKAYELALQAYQDDVAKETARLAAKHNPFIWTAHSVLYEALGQAAFAGFAPDDLVKTMGCANH